jgi:hypothetical protein
MKKLLGILSLMLIASCGGAGSGGGELTITSQVARVEQDIVCCEEYDSNTQTCTQYITPATEKAEYTISLSQDSSEFSTAQDLIFKECSISVVPNPDLPAEAKDPALLELLKSNVICSATDIPAKETGSVEISYTPEFIDAVYQLWLTNKRTYTYTIVATIKYNGANDDTNYTKTVKLTVVLDNFINQENDVCQF